MSRTQSTSIDAKIITARAQFTSYGIFTVNGTVVCGQDSAITIGDQTLRFIPSGYTSSVGDRVCMTITKDGLCLAGGLSLADTPAIAVSSITSDPSLAGANDRQLITALAAKSYIDARALNAQFDTLSVHAIQSRDASPIVIAGSTLMTAPITFNGPITLSTQRITATPSGVALNVGAAIIFIGAETEQTCAVDVSTTTQSIVAQFIKTGNAAGILLRFEFGCIWLDGAIKCMKRACPCWMSLCPRDAFFPSRMFVDPPTPTLATSIAMSSVGHLMITGNATDGGERGCMHVMQRKDNAWFEACPKLVGTCTVNTKHQGLYCAISANARVLASANETDVWIFSITDTCACPYFIVQTTEIAHVVPPFAVDEPCEGLAFNTTGTVLAVASRGSVAIYDISGLPSAPIIGLRFCTRAFVGPIALNCTGQICFAASPDRTAVVRVDLSDPSTPENVGSLQGALSICCNLAGTVYLLDCAATSELRTRITWTDATLIVHHTNLDPPNEPVERARIVMPRNVVSVAIHPDGLMAIVCLEGNIVRAIY